MLFAITPPADNERGPVYAEHLLTALHQANVERVPVSLAFGSHDGQRIGLYCRCSDANLGELIRDQVLAHYDGSRVTELHDDALALPNNVVTSVQELCVRPDIFPIRRHPQFLDETNRRAADPLTTILATLASANRPGLHTVVEIVVVPTRAWRQRQARNASERLASPFFRTHRSMARLYAAGVCNRFLLVRSVARLLGRCASGGGFPGRGDPLSTSVSRTHEREDDLQAATAKVSGHLFETRLRVRVFAAPDQVHAAAHALRSVVSAFGQFKGLAAFVRTRRPRAFLLSAEELAGMWHCPLGTVKAPKMDTSIGRTFEAPPDVPLLNAEPNLAVLGRVYHHQLGEITGLRMDDRYRHVAIVGKSGTGKSTLLQNLIASDLRQGRGVALIDPHGDLADTVLSLVPRSRTNDVVLFDAGDRHHPSYLQWPVVLLGNLGGKLKTNGRFLEYPRYGRPGHRTIGTFYTSLLHAVGDRRESFGNVDLAIDKDATHGPLQEILA